MPFSLRFSRLLPLLLLASSSLAGAGLALTALEAVAPQAAMAQKKPTKPPKPSKPQAGQNSGVLAAPSSTNTEIQPAASGDMNDGSTALP